MTCRRCIVTANSLRKLTINPSSANSDNTPEQNPGSCEGTHSSAGEVECILGIDPGSRRTGYGLIQLDGELGVATYLASGCISTTHPQMAQRLGEILQGLQQVIDIYRPDRMAIEEVFLAKNAQSALKLGQARGVAIAAAVTAGLSVHEYAARRVKQDIVGTGRASKSQIQHMVQRRLNLSGLPQADAADALAIALCHVQNNTRGRAMLRAAGVKSK